MQYTPPPPLMPPFPPEYFFKSIFRWHSRGLQAKEKSRGKRGAAKGLAGLRLSTERVQRHLCDREKSECQRASCTCECIIDNFRLSLRLHRTVHALHALHALQACHTTKGTQRNARHHRARTSLAKFTYSRIVQHHVCTPFFKVNTSTISH